MSLTVIQGKRKGPGTCYSVAYISKLKTSNALQSQKWRLIGIQLMIPRCIMRPSIAHDSEQLDPPQSATLGFHPIACKLILISCLLKVGGWVGLSTLTKHREWFTTPSCEISIKMHLYSSVRWEPKFCIKSVIRRFCSLLPTLVKMSRASVSNEPWLYIKHQTVSQFRTAAASCINNTVYRYNAHTSQKMTVFACQVWPMMLVGRRNHSSIIHRVTMMTETNT